MVCCGMLRHCGSRREARRAPARNFQVVTPTIRGHPAALCGDFCSIAARASRLPVSRPQTFFLSKFRIKFGSKFGFRWKKPSVRRISSCSGHLTHKLMLLSTRRSSGGPLAPAAALGEMCQIWHVSANVCKLRSSPARLCSPLMLTVVCSHM